VRKTVEAGPQDQLRLLLIAIVPQNIKDITVNLKSPVVVNMGKRLAVQAILENSAYPVRYRLFD
jgi:flagellar assembly factor FliW